MSYLRVTEDDRRPVRGPGPEPEALGLLSNNEKSALKIVAVLGVAAIFYFWSKRKKRRR